MHSVKRMGWEKANEMETPPFAPAPKTASSLKPITKNRKAWHQLALSLLSRIQRLQGNLTQTMPR